MRTHFVLAVGVLTWAAFTPVSVVAGTNGFLVPFFRGMTGSQAGYWETFTVPVGAPGNPADRPGSTTGAVLSQSQTNAFLTGSGNLYNLDGVSVLTLSDTPTFGLGTVVLQTRSLGSELDYGLTALTYSNASGVHTLAPLPRVELNRGEVPGLGATVSSLWQWDLTGLGITTYELAFSAAGPSLSFDSLTLDTRDQFTPLFTLPFAIRDTTPSIERWMYPHNAAPCDRPAGSVFATFGDEPGVDTRHAQHLLGWDTAALVPTNRGPARYLVSRCRITLTINRGDLFAYDPTHDGYRTYYETNHPDYLADADAGRPVELFGAGFRNGFDSLSFDQCAPFGDSATGQRNAFAVGSSTHGALVDVSNNVGKTNAAFPRFEVTPFAIGQTTNAAPGELVPAGAKVTFDLDLQDPFVLAYVQAGLNCGRLRFMVASLHENSGQTGTPSYPDFVTRFNAAVLEPTSLELEGVAVGEGDLDADGLPDDWERFYSGGLTFGLADDPDGDGAGDGVEWLAGTNPMAGEDVLQISIQHRLDGFTTVRWPHRASRHYQVESTQDWLTWKPEISTNLFYPERGYVEWVEPGGSSTSIGSRFYRVRAAQE